MSVARANVGGMGKGIPTIHKSGTRETEEVGKQERQASNVPSPAFISLSASQCAIGQLTEISVPQQRQSFSPTALRVWTKQASAVLSSRSALRQLSTAKDGRRDRLAKRRCSSLRGAPILEFRAKEGRSLNDDFHPIIRNGSRNSLPLQLSCVLHAARLSTTPRREG